MQNLSIVDVFESEADLREPIQNMILAPVLQLAASALFLLILVLDAPLQIAAVCIVHHDAQFALLGLVDLSKAHNVRMLKHFQNLGFSQGLSAFILIHVLNVDLLDNGILLV